MSNTTDSVIATAEADTIEARNLRGWTPAEVNQWTPPLPPTTKPVGQTEAFISHWQALMHQLNRILSEAHLKILRPTEYREAISLAMYELTRLSKLAENR
jgi:hypothetical protein